MTATNIPPNRPTLLLVHGAWHRSWCWDQLRVVLDGDGWTTRVVDLPSAGDEAAGIHEDAHALLRELSTIDGPVVVIAHSYGGVPVSQVAAEAANVAHVVYLAAYQLDVGESLLGYHGAPVTTEPRGVNPPLSEPLQALYGDVPQTLAEAAVARLVPQSAKSFNEPLTRAGWHTVPSTYVVCEQDQAVPPACQEDMARRAGAVYRLPSHHSPFLSMPVECAALLTKIAFEAAS
ncbi:alpha/beta fold hydrolase [Actinacidiphila glaucinigra]|uniref:alpha/beta fold hydrolase n=1 Tax=Actinacidiphila glaucinigra TaxID=235986 RepID=UPI002DD8B871|nr:alpha/beta fold hydrolase [Actinacidiphila glaucinigra]WSD57736.1 alpha/beta fold hydrolase [Actinacidiphila glaucinigra]